MWFKAYDNMRCRFGCMLAVRFPQKPALPRGGETVKRRHWHPALRLKSKALFPIEAPVHAELGESEGALQHLPAKEDRDQDQVQRLGSRPDNQRQNQKKS